MARPTRQAETYNPWSVVNLVFSHLAEQGLHPVLGETRRSRPPARAPARALGHPAGGGGQPRGDARRAGAPRARSAPPCSRTPEVARDGP